MHYDEKKVKDASNEELLAALLKRRPPSAAPRRMELGAGGMITTIGIGADSTADIIIFDEDLVALRGLVGD